MLFLFVCVAFAVFLVVLLGWGQSRSKGSEKPENLSESDVPVIVINQDLVDGPSRSLDALHKYGCQNLTILDNGSECAKTLAWYETRDCLDRCTVELATRRPISETSWVSGCVSRVAGTGLYVLVRSDLDLTTLPNDFLAILHVLLKSNRHVAAVGCGILLSDLPETAASLEYIGEAYQDYAFPVLPAGLDRSVRDQYPCYSGRAPTVTLSEAQGPCYTQLLVRGLCSVRLLSMYM